MTKIVKTLDTNLHGSLQSMICQQVTLSGDAEWPKVADAVIEARDGMVSDAVLVYEWERFRNPGVKIYNWLNIIHFRLPSEAECLAARHQLNCVNEAFILC